MDRPIEVAVVDDDRMLIEGLYAWASASGELRLTGAFPTVDDFLGSAPGAPTVVLLDLLLRDRSEPGGNVRRLAEAGHLVLIITAWPEPDSVASAFAAGARGCLGKDKDLATLTAAVKQVAEGGTVYTDELAYALLRDARMIRPHLSAREREMLLAYVSGMTLESAARHLGVKPGTARTYLDRVKSKYEEIGRPARTKLELASRVQEDTRLTDGR